MRALRLEGRGLELFLFGSAGIAGFNLFAFAGLEHTTPEHAALIVATSPLITLLASAALARKAPSPITFGFVLLALAGVLLVIGHGDPLRCFSGGINGGDVLVFLGTASFVVYTLGARRFTDYSSLRYTALSATARHDHRHRGHRDRHARRLATPRRRPATSARSGGSSST